MKTMRTMAAAAALLLAGSAGATTLAFDALERPGTSYTKLAGSYEEQGYRFTTPGNFGATMQNRTGYYYGSAALFIDNPGASLTLSRIDGAAFSLKSIDLAPFSVGFGVGAAVVLTGQVHGGGVVQTRLTIAQDRFQSFALHGFANLDSVSWSQDVPFHQFDNLVLDSPATVPEPGSLALLALAFGGLGLARRRRA